MASPSPSARWPTALCFFVPLAMYAATAARTPQGGDANEFALVGTLGGVAHAPGYPLYTLLLRLVHLLPIGSPYFRMSMASALCAAGAVAVQQRVGARLTGAPSVLAALSVAGIPVLWRVAGIPEVFALHALLVGLALLTFLRLIEAPRETLLRESFFFGLVLGLGMANQQTMILVGPLIGGAITAVVQRLGKRVLPGALAIAFAGGILGLTPYLLLIAWGKGDPVKQWIWGHTDTWSGFWTHLLRSEFGTMQLLPGQRQFDWGARFRLVKAFLLAWPRAYAGVFFLLGLYGVAAGWRQNPIAARSIATCFVLAGLVFPLMMNIGAGPVQQERAQIFFLMPLVLFGPFVALGTCEAIRRWRWRSLPPVPVLGVVLLASALATAPTANWRSDTVVERYLAASVKPLAKDAVIIGLSDTLMSGYGWVTRVQKIRPDVHYVDVNLLRSPWYAERIHRELPDVPLPDPDDAFGANDIAAPVARVRPTYVIPSIADQVREQVALEPDGLLFRVVPAGTAAISVDEQARRLTRDLRALGSPVEQPVDAWSALIRQAIVLPMADLMERYKDAGRSAEAEQMAQEIALVIPGEYLANAR